MTDRSSIETATITIARYRDPDGKPTCCADHSAGMTCRFLGVRKFGTTDVCMLGEPIVLLRDDYTRPLDKCEVWKGAQ